MSGRSGQQDWDSYSSRARQPGSRGTAGRGGARKQAGARMPGARPEGSEGGGRSRFVALVVLVVAAVIVAIGGLAATQGDVGGGSGVTVPISLLPLDQDASTTTTQ